MADLTPFYRGDTRILKILVQNDNGSSSPTPVNVTGDVFTVTFKPDQDLPDWKAPLQVSVTAASGGSPASDPANGIVYLTLTSEMTDLLDGGVEYFYDVQRTESGSPPVVSTLVLGKVKVLKDVTRTP